MITFDSITTSFGSLLTLTERVEINFRHHHITSFLSLSTHPIYTTLSHLLRYMKLFKNIRDSQFPCFLETDTLVKPVLPPTSSLETNAAFIRKNDAHVKPDLIMASSIETNAEFILENNAPEQPDLNLESSKY